MFDLIKAFIALCFLVPLIDSLTMWLEENMRHVPWLPNNFNRRVAYVVVSGLALLICWQGRFDFFCFLGFSFPAWEGWLATALLLGAGSKYSQQAFGQLNGIAQFLAAILAAAMGIMAGMDTVKAVKKEGEHN